MWQTGLAGMLLVTLPGSKQQTWTCARVEKLKGLSGVKKAVESIHKGEIGYVCACVCALNKHRITLTCVESLKAKSSLLPEEEEAVLGSDFKIANNVRVSGILKHQPNKRPNRKPKYCTAACGRTSYALWNTRCCVSQSAGEVMPLIPTKIKMLKCLDTCPNKHKWKSLLLGESSEHVNFCRSSLVTRSSCLYTMR